MQDAVLCCTLDVDGLMSLSPSQPIGIFIFSADCMNEELAIETTQPWHCAYTSTLHQFKKNNRKLCQRNSKVDADNR